MEKAKIADFKLKALTVRHVMLGVGLLLAIWVSSFFIDQFSNDACAEYMCNHVYGSQGKSEVDSCLQREADRQVANQK